MEIAKQREFLLKEKLLSFRDKVKVMTPDKEELGYFKGKLIKIGNTYRLYNIDDESETNALLTVHEKVVSMRSTYTFYKGGEQVDDKFIGKLKRKIVSIKPSYWFEDPNETRLFTMKGNIWQLKYKILYQEKEVAEISKKLFRIKGTYGIKMRSDITDEMAILILGIVVMLHHEKEENR
ncbi:MAG: LURP-one-related/scramblase family protein [Candidatus Hodarchaeota archaeon]